jgi:AraC-type transcriptional regulator
MSVTYPQGSEHEPGRKQAYREELAERIARAVPEDGRVEPLKGLHLNRASTPTEPLYALCVIAQGSKEALLGESRYRYDPAHYLSAASSGSSAPGSARAINSSGT